ncbi:TPA: hypothetical protein ACH3X3_004758 [Trebouxia sp. C0006]
MPEGLSDDERLAWEQASTDPQDCEESCGRFCMHCQKHFHGRRFREPHPPVQDVVHLHCQTCAKQYDLSGDYPLCLPCATEVLRRGTCPAPMPHRLGSQARSMPRNFLRDIIDS